jgi:phosphatidylserine/phosphatidylglycerophosphate/cardiolipin synthase-like enzyme
MAGDPVLLDPDTDPAKVKVTAPAVVTKSGVDTDVLPPSRGRVVPLFDGEATYAEMYDAVENATDYIYLSLWYMHPDAKLFDRTGKRSRTITELLRRAAKRGVKVRVIVSYLESQPITLGNKTIRMFSHALDSDKIASALNRLDKNVVAIVYKHPFFRRFQNKQLRPGTAHEKTMLVDGRVAFCGGLEFEDEFTHSNPTHKPWQPDESPRHDVHTMITGPIVAHFEQHFVTRWRAAKSKADLDLPNNHTNFSAKDDVHAVQVTLTRSIDGSVAYITIDQTIADSYIAAVKAAKRYIYIENQYFRDQRLTDALVARLAAVQDLEVILLLPEAAEEKPNAFAEHATFVEKKMLDQLVKAAPQRFGMFSLRVAPFRRGGSYPADVYVHAKVMIVDDKWLTVGSANANPRSFYLDDEINVVVRDDTVAHDTRVALWTEHFQAAGNTAVLGTFELSAAKSLLGLWTAAAKLKTAGQKSATRIEFHVPKPGAELKLPPPLQLLLGLNPDLFVLEERRLPRNAIA